MEQAMLNLMQKIRAVSVFLAIFFVCVACSESENGNNPGNPDSQKSDGDVYADGDNEHGNNPDGPKSDISLAPDILDPGQMTALFGSKSETRNLDFGAVVDGATDNANLYAGFSFDAVPGARITIQVTGKSETLRPALALYGPQLSNGLWGRAVAADNLDGGNDKSVVADYLVEAPGAYLAMIFDADLSGGGEFSVSLGCRNQCAEPACPDLSCQIYCDGGRLSDLDGCPICRCAESPACMCGSDGECAVDQICKDCQCVPSSLADNLCGCDKTSYKPVCGIGEVTYPNECIANCLGALVVSDGECVPEIDSIECTLDSHCPETAVCVNGFCKLKSECDCPSYTEALCGADGKTYSSNTCQMACKGITVLYRGECGEQKTICDPICGQTGGNDTWVDGCSGDPIIKQDCQNCLAFCLYPGTAEEGWYSSCDRSLIRLGNCCAVSLVWSPVCGADGKNYDNARVAECAGVAWIHSGTCEGSEATPCSINADCPSGQICQTDPTCNPVEGQTCSAYCVEPPSSQACNTDSDCVYGMICSGGFCAAPLGESCVVTGCHHELCASLPTPSECAVWSPDYLCLAYASCTSVGGNCQWVPSKEDYHTCMSSYGAGTLCNKDSDCSQGMFCQQGRCSQADCLCPQDDAAVCGDGTDYLNACQATCGNASTIQLGACP